MNLSGDNIEPQKEDTNRGDTPNNHVCTTMAKLIHPYINEAQYAPTLKASGVPLLQSQPFQKEAQLRRGYRRIRLLTETEEQTRTNAEIDVLATIPVLGVEHRESEIRQQDMFTASRRKDIECLDTVLLPVMASSTKQQAQSVEHQEIANAAGNAAVAGVGDIISAILRYTTNVVMTNMFSQEIYGTYVAVYTAAILVGYIAPLGMDSTLARFLPTHLARREHDRASGLLRFTTRMTLIVGLFSGFCLFVAAPVLAHSIYHQELYVLPLREASLLVPLTTLQVVLVSGLQALKAVKWKVYVDRLIQPGLTLVFICIFYLLGLQLQGLIFATLLGFLVSVIVGQILLSKAAKRSIHRVVPRYEVKLWLHFALPMSFNSMVLNTLSSTDVLFLSAFATWAQVGLYAAPDRASVVITMPLLALNIIFAPVIAEYHALGKHEQLTRMAKIVTKWSFSLSWPIFLCYCIFHEAILSIFSKGYTTAGLVLMILSFGNLIDAGVGCVWSLLAMTGHARVVLVNTLVTLTFNIGLSFLLVPHYNIIGAAIASSLSVILMNVMAVFEVFFILKILTFRWDMLKSVAAGGVASACGILLVRIVHIQYGYQAIVGVLLLVVPFLLIYILTLALLRFSEDDKIIFDSIFIKFSGK